MEVKDMKTWTVKNELNIMHCHNNYTHTHNVHNTMNEKSTVKCTLLNER